MTIRVWRSWRAVKITLDVPDTTEGFEILAAIRSEGGVRARHGIKRATVESFIVPTIHGDLAVTLPKEPAPSPRPPATRKAVINPIPADPDRHA